VAAFAATLLVSGLLIGSASAARANSSRSANPSKAGPSYSAGQARSGAVKQTPANTGQHAVLQQKTIRSATVSVADGTATAAVRTAGTPSEMGISFIGDGDPGQCGGPQQQWAPSPDWTNPIRFDTDNRGGGCQLAFGVRDLASDLAGLTLNYRWEVSPGGDGGQCGNQGEFSIPITRFLALGPSVRVDTDGRGGWCNLTFMMSGRTGVALDVQYWADGDGGQCINALPQGQWRSVRPGAPITIGVDADNRGGGCQLSLRLRKF
jgi:hypothetical protein